MALAAALCAVPLSIAVSESLLGAALLARILRIVQHRADPRLPRIFWYWLCWAGLEVAGWACSPRNRAGAGEMRHLLLLMALFVTLPALSRPARRLAIWRGIFFTSSLGSLAVVFGFVSRLIRYRHEIATGGDSSFYLRNGGFLHHWMVYATVEIVVFGALVEFLAFYPEERRWAAPAFAIHCLAIILSLTRALWLGCLLLLGLHLIRRHSRWIWALPSVPVLVFVLAPGPVRHRMAESFQPDYYSNAERLQMWRVGWKMVMEHPGRGVGPGLVEELYARYLPPGEALPAYHGHLHNNALQLAAQFGLPVLGAAVLCLAVWLRSVLEARRRASDREARFLCNSALAGMAGFLIAGMTDYTYGHSLGLMLLGFAAVSPLIPARASGLRRVYKGREIGGLKI